MRVIVDRERCQSRALRMAAAPDVFLVEDDDVLHVLDEAPDDRLRSQVEVAVRSCPRAAPAPVD